LVRQPELAKGISVVAFDPGVTTGVFIRTANGKGERAISFSYKEMLDTVAFTPAPSPTLLIADVWVIESFQLYKHKGMMTKDALTPVEIIGMLKVLAKRLGIKEVIFQTAQAAKGFVDDERLKSYGWTLRSPHQRDAARHAVLYLSKKRQLQEREERNAATKADKPGLQRGAGGRENADRKALGRTPRRSP